MNGVAVSKVPLYFRQHQVGKQPLTAVLLRLDRNTELARVVALMFRPDNQGEFAS